MNKFIELCILRLRSRDAKTKKETLVLTHVKKKGFFGEDIFKNSQNIGFLK